MACVVRVHLGYCGVRVLCCGLLISFLGYLNLCTSMAVLCVEIVDVEGFELDVLMGLTQKAGIISFEFS